MKRNILYLLVGLFAFLPGCLKEQQDLFPSSAAVRINSTIEGIDSVLTHAHNGWLMQYFADSVSPGYSMLVSFNENSETKVAAKNELVGNEYTEAVSVFDVIGDNGPVLTFNTFNDVLHLFSNPVNPDGVGLGGDYEFVVKAYSDSLLRMRGKKNGAEIVMTPLPVNLSWREYLDKLEGVDAELFGVEPIYLVSGNDTFPAYGGSSHIFELWDGSENEPAYIPFIVTDNGLRFYSPYKTNRNKKVRNFYRSGDGEKIISYEDENTYFIATTIVDYFLGSHETFVFDTTQMSDHFKMPILTMSNKLAQKYNGRRNFDFMALSYDNVLGYSFLLSTAPVVTKANYKIEILAQASGGNRVSISKVDGVSDSNGQLFLSGVPEIEDVWESLEGSYVLMSAFSKKEIKFVDSGDSSRFFVVTKK